MRNDHAAQAYARRHSSALSCIAPFAALGAAAGCSAPIPTDELDATLYVIAREAAVSVSADFKTCEEVEGSNGVFLCREPAALSGGDSVRVQVGDLDYPMEETGTGSYSATLAHSPPRSEYTIELRRDDAVDARSTVTLPPPFSFSGSPGTVSRAEDRLAFDLELPDDWDHFITDEYWDCDGSWTFGHADWRFDRSQRLLWLEAGEFERPPELDGAAPSCIVVVTVTLRQDGDADPAFLFGDIYGKQRRWVEFTSVP